MAKRQRLPAVIETTAQDPAVRAVAASAVAASGAIAAGKLVKKKVAARRLHERARYRLDLAETPLEGIGRVARGQLDLTIGLLEGAGDGGDSAESVHEARKALKRLRALLRVSRGVLDDDRYRHENVVLRDAGRELSEARDAQVLLDTLDDLRRRFADEMPAEAWPRLRERLAAAAREAHHRGPNGSIGLLGAQSDARVRVSTWPLPHDGGPETLGDGLRRIYRRGRRAFQSAEAEPSAENLHKLRKRAKDLWHAGQLLRPVCPERMKKLSKRAHRLSDLLGDDHDLAVLLERTRSHPELLDPAESAVLVALVERRRSALQKEALERGARLYRRKPGKLVHRLNLA
jgi:CHAD domain-containing protein